MIRCGVGSRPRPGPTCHPATLLLSVGYSQTNIIFEQLPHDPHCPEGGTQAYREKQRQKHSSVGLPLFNDTLLKSLVISCEIFL